MENGEKTKDEGRKIKNGGWRMEDGKQRKDESLKRLKKITFKKFKSYIEIYFEA